MMEIVKDLEVLFRKRGFEAAQFAREVGGSRQTSEHSSQSIACFQRTKHRGNISG
jgi:hypothetical protein